MAWLHLANYILCQNIDDLPSKPKYSIVLLEQALNSYLITAYYETYRSQKG